MTKTLAWSALAAMTTLGLFLLIKPTGSPSLEDKPSSSQRLGTIHGNGDYWTRSSHDVHFDKQTDSSPLEELQTLLTPKGTSLRLELDSGAIILLSESTYAIVDHSLHEGSVEVLLYEGAGEILQNSPQMDVQILRSQIPEWTREEISSAQNLDSPFEASPPEEETLSAAAEETQSLDTEPASRAHSKAELPPRRVADNSLEDEYIQQILDRQMRFMRSCFIKYFHQQKGQVEMGTTLIGFLIERNGRVSRADIITSDISDEAYQNCIRSVISRTRFRPFTGTPIEVEYPVELVLPR